MTRLPAFRLPRLRLRRPGGRALCLRLLLLLFRLKRGVAPARGGLPRRLHGRRAARRLGRRARLLLRHHLLQRRRLSRRRRALLGPEPAIGVRHLEQALRARGLRLHLRQLGLQPRQLVRLHLVRHAAHEGVQRVGGRGGRLAGLAHRRLLQGDGLHQPGALRCQRLLAPKQGLHRHRLHLAFALPRPGLAAAAGPRLLLLCAVVKVVVAVAQVVVTVGRPLFAPGGLLLARVTPRGRRLAAQGRADRVQQQVLRLLHLLAQLLQRLLVTRQLRGLPHR
mmetsp:Transcript_27477/g.70629  ORF Transcript_27477/g.70629 Transcript_27477/m.70629 type:complete len:279 (-) Transcript_27477:580-1416(-)